MQPCNCDFRKKKSKKIYAKNIYATTVFFYLRLVYFPIKGVNSLILERELSVTGSM